MSSQMKPLEQILHAATSVCCYAFKCILLLNIQANKKKCEKKIKLCYNNNYEKTSIQIISLLYFNNQANNPIFEYCKYAKKYYIIPVRVCLYVSVCMYLHINPRPVAQRHRVHQNTITLGGLSEPSSLTGRKGCSPAIGQHDTHTHTRIYTQAGL